VISKPRIVTELPNLPDTGLASISIDMLLSNNGSAPTQGTVQVSISPDNFAGAGGPTGQFNPTVQFSKAATVGAGGSTQIHLTAADIPSLLIHHPKLGGLTDMVTRIYIAFGSALQMQTAFQTTLRLCSASVRSAPRQLQ
jgi:hypothetical protein